MVSSECLMGVQAEPLSDVALKVYQGKKTPEALKSITAAPLQLPSTLTPETLAALVERRHPELVLANLYVQRAEAKQQTATGSFDPRLEGGTGYKRFNSSTMPESPLEAFQHDVAVTQRLRSGATVEAGWQQNRGNLSFSVSPTGQGGEWGVSLTQPLLQYRGINPQLAQERQAELEQQVAVAGVRLVRLNLLAEAQHAYWAWQEQYNTVFIHQQLVQLASERKAQVDRRATTGDLPLIDVTEAEQTLQRRRVSFTKAKEAFLKQGLKLLWYVYPQPQQWNEVAQQLSTTDITPLPTVWKTYQPPQQLQPTDVGGNVLLALQKRPEFSQLTLSEQLSKIDLALARTTLLPKLDLILSPGYQVGEAGIGGTLKAGLKFSVPLRNNTALGKVRLAEVDLASVDAKSQLTLQKIHLALETLAVQWQQGWQQAEQAYQAWQQSEALAVAERRRFELGDSTLFLVNRRESDAAAAQEAWLQAFVDTQHTLVELQRECGTL
ncbi:MAG: TolC family protein [Vampirovibrionales bacterium]